MRKIIAAAIVATLLSGCGEPRIDGSSEEAFHKSMSKVAESLPEENRKQFTADVMLLAFQNMDIGKVMSGKQRPEDVPGIMLSSLNGKTAAEVSAEASRVREARAMREKEQALSEISDLMDKKRKSELAKVELEKFEVLKSRYYKRKVEYSFMDDSVIELNVRNGTDKAVSRAFFKGTISSPGRSVPWLVEEFNHSIAGGMEPGESQSWSLAPNSFSAWGKVNPPTDAVLTVEVVRLNGADGKPIFGDGEFTERDADRLESLRKQYPN
ncbi:DUF6694 family lipoprotein [Pseudomonas putida]|uniref:DUF6694 family lipoprotein n=1 Tax=Pseudomonas putida TaxID=303 RepID=UPI00034EDCE9|nr:DUF6694 family lipoprotein [Pseudomonas putida]AGN83339.1 hypothetical protein L483_28330 [Pseudomonas putida H8234]HDS1814312.1 hypothetical protein [Pseudomonas putida]HDS3810830.1 hypothetical protein [Pseudomonas putida]